MLSRAIAHYHDLLPGHPGLVADSYDHLYTF